MDNLVSINPGLMIWTIIIFVIFFLLLMKFGAKPIANALKAREERINSQIDAAEKANIQAQENLNKSEEKLSHAQDEVNKILAKGNELKNLQTQKAAEEADEIKKKKIEEAVREIQRTKESAIKELRGEIAGMVLDAVEKILDEKLDKDKDTKLIESYIDKIPNNQN